VAIPDAHRRLYRDTPALQERFTDPYAGGELRQLLDSRAGAESTPAALPPPSLGYGAGAAALDGDKLKRLLRAMLSDPRLGKTVARRALQVLGREGVGGVLRRLR
jgi:hypothetical protein